MNQDTNAVSIGGVFQVAPAAQPQVSVAGAFVPGSSFDKTQGSVVVKSVFRADAGDLANGRFRR